MISAFASPNISTTKWLARRASWNPLFFSKSSEVLLLILQKDMLEDHKRTGAYYQAVMQNRRQFEGKVVLDVGTGSGILAIFAAKAGAKKVYAVEATKMAKFAKQLVKSNGVNPRPMITIEINTSEVLFMTSAGANAVSCACSLAMW